MYELEQDISMHSNNYSSDLIHEFLLAGAKIKYLSGETRTDTKTEMENYIASWKYCHDLLRKDGISPVTNINVRQQISKIATRIAELSEKDERYCNLLTTNSAIVDEINARNNDPVVIRNSLEAYSLNHLKACCDATSNVKECYFILSKYCYEKLSRNANDVEISREFVNSTLKAMSNGSIFRSSALFSLFVKIRIF